MYSHHLTTEKSLGQVSAIFATCCLDGQFLVAKANLGTIKCFALLHVKALVVDENGEANGTYIRWDDSRREICAPLQLLVRIRRIDISTFEFHWHSEKLIVALEEKENEIALLSTHIVSGKGQISVYHHAGSGYIRHVHLATFSPIAGGEVFFSHFSPDCVNNLTNLHDWRLPLTLQIGFAGPPNGCKVLPPHLHSPRAQRLRCDRKGSPLRLNRLDSYLYEIAKLPHR